MDRAWRATVHGVAKSQTRLSDFHITLLSEWGEGCSCCYTFTVNTFPISPSLLGCGLLSFKPCLWALYDSI